jgi:hypothetical protein
MIRPTIHDALVKPYKVGWIVEHPHRGIVLAYCDTRDEAVAYREALNDLPRQLRGYGQRVA